MFIPIVRPLQRIQPGSITFASPGTATFTVPDYDFFIVELWGGGASGAAYSDTDDRKGLAGGATSFTCTGPNAFTLTGGGATGFSSSSTGGSGGTASGGDINVAGSKGGPYQYSGTTKVISGFGGDAYLGGEGGPGVTSTSNNVWRSGISGTTPGAGGSGMFRSWGGPSMGMAGGGAGGYVKKTWSREDSPILILPGSVASIVVGAGGASRASNSNTVFSGAGAPGKLIISWR